MTGGTRDSGSPGRMTTSLRGRDDVAHFLERWATRSSSFIISAGNPGMIHAFGGWTCQLSHHRLDGDAAACEARSSPRSVSGHSPPRSHQPSCRTFHFPPCRRATPKTCSTTSTGSSDKERGMAYTLRGGLVQAHLRTHVLQVVPTRFWKVMHFLHLPSMKALLVNCSRPKVRSSGRQS